LANGESGKGASSYEVPHAYKDILSPAQYAKIHEFLELVGHPGIQTIRRSVAHGGVNTAEG